LGGNTIGGNVFITQGNGSSDTITLADTSIGGRTSIEVGDGSGDTINVEYILSFAFGVTFGKDVSIKFGDGGNATLNVGFDQATFDRKATFSAGGTGNTYNQGSNAVFLPGQPTRHNI
jgi:hypothetical protein